MTEYTLSLFAIIGIGLATMFFGYFFGLAEGRNQGYKRRKKEEAQEVKPMPAPQVPASPPVASPQVFVRDDPGLLRLKNENNQLVLEVDGDRLNTTPLQPAQRKRLIDLLTLIRPFLEGAAPAQPASPRSVAPPPQQAPQASTLTPVERQAVFGGQVQPKVEPVPAKITLPFGTKKKEEPVLSPLTMVEQIDAILQTRIANTPFAALGLKIQEGPGGLVNVIVGDKKYEGVGDVPDPNVQAVLRAAVEEWEKKFTPGL
jgi:hypothetical protein